MPSRFDVPSKGGAITAGAGAGGQAGISPVQTGLQQQAMGQQARATAADLDLRIRSMREEAQARQEDLGFRREIAVADREDRTTEMDRLQKFRVEAADLHRRKFDMDAESFKTGQDAAKLQVQAMERDKLNADWLDYNNRLGAWSSAFKLLQDTQTADTGTQAAMVPGMIQEVLARGAKVRAQVRTPFSSLNFKDAPSDVAGAAPESLADAMQRVVEHRTFREPIRRWQWAPGADEKPQKTGDLTADLMLIALEGRQTWTDAQGKTWPTGFDVAKALGDKDWADFKLFIKAALNPSMTNGKDGTSVPWSAEVQDDDQTRARLMKYDGLLEALQKTGGAQAKAIAQRADSYLRGVRVNGKSVGDQVWLEGRNTASPTEIAMVAAKLVSSIRGKYSYQKQNVVRTLLGTSLRLAGDGDIPGANRAKAAVQAALGDADAEVKANLAAFDARTAALLSNPGVIFEQAYGLDPTTAAERDKGISNEGED